MVVPRSEVDQKTNQSRLSNAKSAEEKWFQPLFAEQSCTSKVFANNLNSMIDPSYLQEDLYPSRGA